MTNKPQAIAEEDEIKVWTAKQMYEVVKHTPSVDQWYKTFISTDDVKKMLNGIKNTYLNAGGSKNTNSGVLLLKLISNKHRQIQPKDKAG